MSAISVSGGSRFSPRENLSRAYRGKLRVTLGPPGTGKTRQLLCELRAELERGTEPERIAFVTFTRAARREAVRRVQRDFGFSRSRMPWFRTIHSTAYRLLGMESERVLDDEWWGKFAEEHGYRLSRTDLVADDLDAAPVAFPRALDDDALRYVSELAQNLDVPTARALTRVRGKRVTLGRLERFEAHLAAFKREHGLVGFADMLEGVLRQGLRPPVDVAFIDEAQDLSPLQIAVVEAWFAPCTRVYVAGDDDQAIYGFQGASPAWLLSLARRGDTRVLAQSYRVPVVAHALAQRVIARNREREPKDYLPKAAFGSLAHLDLDRAVERIDGSVSTFVLSRNRLHLSPVAKELIARAVPYVVEGRGARSPYSNWGARQAIDAARQVLAGEPVVREQLVVLIEQAGKPWSERKSLVQEATEQGRLQGFALDGALALQTLGLQGLLDQLRAEGPVGGLHGVEFGDRRYFQALLDRHGELPEPQVVLTSMHGAKVREAQRVLLLPGMTSATWDEYHRSGRSGFEAENRVAYVGITRTQDELIVVRPKGRKRYEFPREERAR